MKKTAPPTLGLAGNNAGDNQNALGLHAAGHWPRGAQKSIENKKGRPAGRPIALEAMFVTICPKRGWRAWQGPSAPELLMALSAGPHDGLERGLVAGIVAGLGGGERRFGGLLAG